MRYIRTILALLALSALLGGCEEWDWEEWLTGESERGTLTLGLAAAPDTLGAQEIRLRIRAVELQPSGSGSQRELIEFSSPREIDLLAVDQTDRQLLLNNRRIRAGTYDSVRLLLDANANVLDSFVRIDGTPHPITANAGIRPEGSIRVAPRDSADYTIRIDLRQALLPAERGATGFELRPRSWLVRQDRRSTLSGNVAEALLTNCPPDAEPAVYIFSGTNVTPTDMRPTGGPLATATVENHGGGIHRYVAAFLPRGDYTLAFTCRSGDDNPRTSNDLDSDDFAPHRPNVRDLRGDTQQNINR